MPCACLMREPRGRRARTTWTEYWYWGVHWGNSQLASNVGNVVSAFPCFSPPRPHGAGHCHCTCALVHLCCCALVLLCSCGVVIVCLFSVCGLIKWLIWLIFVTPLVSPPFLSSKRKHNYRYCSPLVSLDIIHQKHTIQ